LLPAAARICFRFGFSLFGFWFTSAQVDAFCEEEVLEQVSVMRAGVA
jgi:hypothetical protein